MVSCTTVGRDDRVPAAQDTPHTVTVIADGESRQIVTSAATVSDALDEAGIHIGPFDEVDPPLGTQLSTKEDGAPVTITIVRVTESLEVIPENISYARRIVRSAEMDPEAPPRILQTGVTGLKETSYRIIFRDGLETERWPTTSAIIEPAVDEIVMIGVREDEPGMQITGRLAYISGGRAIILTGSTDSARQLPIEGQLDGRVFQLSPGGHYLLYTIGKGEEAGQTEFRNELWIIPTTEGGLPQSLRVENVLWAGWDPAGLAPLRIAYTTARSISLPPGWEANNDLWLMEVVLNDDPPAPIRLITTMPATFGWWGGTFAWAPTGDRLAYAFADEVGILEIPETLSDDIAGFTSAIEPERTILHTFPAYETHADWAWLPNPVWSADGQLLAFTENTDDGSDFNLVVVNLSTGNVIWTLSNVGIWSIAQWSPLSGDVEQLTLSRIDDPAGEKNSDYSLWMVDSNGEQARRIFPIDEERGTVARSSQSIAWGPDSNHIAFIFDDELHILNLASGELYRAGSDDAAGSHPTWAPYGAAAGR